MGLPLVCCAVRLLLCGGVFTCRTRGLLPVTGCWSSCVAVPALSLCGLVVCSGDDVERFSGLVVHAGGGMDRSNGLFVVWGGTGGFTLDLRAVCVLLGGVVC